MRSSRPHPLSLRPRPRPPRMLAPRRADALRMLALPPLGGHAPLRLDLPERPELGLPRALARRPPRLPARSASSVAIGRRRDVGLVLVVRDAVDAPPARRAVRLERGHGALSIDAEPERGQAVLDGRDAGDVSGDRRSGGT